MRRATAAATIAAAVATALPAAASQATPHRIVLTGARTAYADVVLEHAADVDLRTVSTSGHGRFQGFYAERLDSKPADRNDAGNSTGVVSLRDYHAPDDPGATAIGLGPRITDHLAPGRYRFYLMADGPATVTIPVSGVRSRTVSPTHVVSATAVVDKDILTSPVTAADRKPIDVKKRAISVSSVLVGRFRVFAGEIGTCLTPRGGRCGEGTSTGIDGPFIGYILSPLNSTAFSLTYVYQPGSVTAGAADAVHEAVDPATLQFALGAAFTLELQG